MGKKLWLKYVTEREQGIIFQKKNFMLQIPYDADTIKLFEVWRSKTVVGMQGIQHKLAIFKEKRLQSTDDGINNEGKCILWFMSR